MSGKRGGDLLQPYGASQREKTLLGGMPGDAQTLLMQQIKLVTLREMRAMSELEQLKRNAQEAENDAQPLDDITVKDSTARGKAALDSEQSASERTIKRRSVFDARQQIEAQLHKLHEQKLKAIELLARLEDNRQETQSGDGMKFRIYIPDNGRGHPGYDGDDG